MLFNIEWAGVQIEPEPSDLEFAIWENHRPAYTDWIRNQLGNQRANSNRRSTHGEKHVESRANGTEKHANDPHT